METKSWNFIDKSTWGPGPWQGEPDKLQWLDNETGYPCLVHRGPVGGLCGYVGIPPDHPNYAKDYNDADVSVHGGLTFGSKSQKGFGEFGEKGGGICHTVEPGESDDVFWLGFDCAHLGDQLPDPRIGGMTRDGQYRTLDYVQAEIQSLARQLKALHV